MTITPTQKILIAGSLASAAAPLIVDLWVDDDTKKLKKFLISSVVIGVLNLAVYSAFRRI